MVRLLVGCDFSGIPTWLLDL